MPAENHIRNPFEMAIEQFGQAVAETAGAERVRRTAAEADQSTPAIRHQPTPWSRATTAAGLISASRATWRMRRRADR